MSGNPNETDISQITDIDKLQSMAYREVVAKTNAERNLQVIETRIQQVAVEQFVPKDGGRQDRTEPTPATPNAEAPANASEPTAKPAADPAKPE